MKTLCIIPARGGSKGVKDKNIIEINNKPLIAYSINVALEALSLGVIDRAIVSTDSDLISQVSISYGIEVPFLRPLELSGDHAKSASYVSHALEFFHAKGEIFDSVLILQPTSPMRKVEDIKKAVTSFASSDSYSLVSVYEEGYVNDLVSYWQDGEFLVPVHDLHCEGSRRQDHGSRMVRNGSIYLFRVSFFIETGRLICDRPMAYRMSKVNSLNIDSHEDLDLARKLL